MKQFGEAIPLNLAQSPLYLPEHHFWVLYRFTLHHGALHYARVRGRQTSAAELTGYHWTSVCLSVCPSACLSAAALRWISSRTAGH